MSSVYYVSIDMPTIKPTFDLDEHAWYFSYAEEEALLEAELAAYKELI